MTEILEQVILHGSLELLSTRIFSVSMALTTSDTQNVRMWKSFNSTHDSEDRKCS